MACNQAEGNIHRRRYEVVERQARGFCGCPLSRSACERNCQQKHGENIVGRCSGFLWFTCSCLINGCWVTIANEC